MAHRAAELVCLAIAFCALPTRAADPLPRHSDGVQEQVVLLHGLENVGACWATPDGAAFAASWKYTRRLDVPWWQIITNAEELTPPDAPDIAGRITP